MEQKNKSYFRDVAGVSFTFSAGGQLVFTGGQSFSNLISLQEKLLLDVQTRRVK